MAKQSVYLELVVKGQAKFDQAAKSIAKVEKAANKITPTGGKVSKALAGIGASARAAVPGIGAMGAALSAALGPIAAVTSAAALLSKSLNTAFERGAAEQKLRNFTSSTEEYNAALAVASKTAEQFGMSQTEATTALADTYSRLKGLGFGLKETSEIYSGFQAIVLQSGTSAEDAAGAFLQLSQALGSGKLQGDELRSILERMPQLAQRIADTMGVSAAQIRQLGADGKITSEIIYEALSGAAAGADEFGNRLNAQQTAMKALGRAADQAFNGIGKALEPVIVAITQGLTWAITEMTEIWEYLAANVFPKVVEAVQPVIKAIQEAFKDVDWEAIGKAIKLYIIGYFEALVVVVRQVSKAIAFVIGVFKKLADSPAFKAILWPLQKAVELLGGIKDPVKEWKEEQSKATEETAKTVENYSKLPQKVEDVKGKAKELAAAQKEVTNAIKEGAAALDRQFQAQESLAGLQFELGQQRLKTEQALTNVLLEQAQRQLQSAQSAQEKEQAAQRIYQLTIKLAKLELQATKAAIVESVRKVEAQRDLLDLKAKEVATIVKLAEAQGVVTEQHYEALGLAEQTLLLAEQKVAMQAEIAAEQIKEAEALYRGKEAAAKAAYEQNKVFESTKGAASEAGKFANNMAKAASAAVKTQSALDAGMEKMGASNSSTTMDAAHMSRIRAAIQKYHGGSVATLDPNTYSKIVYGTQSGNNYRPGPPSLKEKEMARSTPGGQLFYASGGYIRKGEVGIVGEKGPELVEGPAMVTSNPRLKAAMAGDGSGGLPTSTVQVTYNGETINFNDEQYIRKADVGSMINAAVKGVQKQMAGNPRYRLESGMA